MVSTISVVPSASSCSLVDDTVDFTIDSAVDVTICSPSPSSPPVPATLASIDLTKASEAVREAVDLCKRCPPVVVNDNNEL